MIKLKLQHLLAVGLVTLLTPALAVAQTVDGQSETSQQMTRQELLQRAALEAWAEVVGHMRENRPRAAIPILERLVSLAPSETRFRLELARAYFLVQDDEKAGFHFEQARGGDLPQEARNAIQTYEDRIRERKRWQAQFSFAIVPETNPGRRTNAETVTILGQQFTLNEQAKAATALHMTGRLTYLPPITRDLSGRISGSVDARLFENSALNDIRLGTELGLSLRADGGRETGVGLTGSRRWVGSSAFSYSYGVYVTFETRLTERTRLRFRGDLERVRHDNLQNRDGIRRRAQVELTHVVSPKFGLRASTFVGHTNARADFESGLQAGVRVGATYAFDGGLVTSMELGHARERRDAASSLFQRVRSDRTSSLTIGLLHREIEFAGYAPRLDLFLERRKSTIEVYDFNNARVSIGLTRSF